MYSDDEVDDGENNRRDSVLELQRFLDRSHFYLERLPVLKIELNDVDRINQPDVYIEKLNEIGNLIVDLSHSIRHTQQLHSQLDENEYLTLDYQIHRLLKETEREMSEFHRLREQFNLSMNETTPNLTDETDQSNELQQQQVTVTRVNDSYDLLERDLATLRETIDEIATLLARQEQMITRMQQLRDIAQVRVHNASLFFHNIIHNRYMTITSGALIGATLGGPVGF
ncbi:unnamed protein product, partial [Adineta ricciae]